MSFILEVFKNGKDVILYENNKYREAYSVKNGDVTWRCLGRHCKAAVKTNSEKTVIFSTTGTHSGPHPVTMRALQTPTPPQRRRSSASATPAAETDPSRASATPAAETAPPRASACSSTPLVSLTAEPLTPSAQQASCVDGPQESAEPRVVIDLRAENAALREELEKLRLEMRVILDHSIESDQRLLQFTEDVFLPPPSLASTASGHKDSLRAKEELELMYGRVTELEEEIKSLRSPCERCKILREETNNMIVSLRCLEAENLQLKKDLLSTPFHASPTVLSSAPVPVQNRFQVLEEEEEDQPRMGADFITVAKKNKTGNKKKLFKIKTPIKDRKYPKQLQKQTKKSEANLYTSFSNITVVGDSHVRNLTSMIQQRLRAGTSVSGMCKPGAGLLGVVPTSSPPRNHCYVLMAGTNDVDAGREDVLFSHLEDVLTSLKKTSRVLVVPLTTRYDLNPSSPLHDAVRLVNSYMAELCHRHQGVEWLDTSSIGRRHHTAHGLHLRDSGKRALAGLIAERLACMSRPPRPRRPPPRPAAAAAPALTTPITLPYETYAEAVAQSSNTCHLPSYQASKTVTNRCNSSFLDNAIPTNSQN